MLWGAIGVAVGIAIYVSLRGIGPAWPLTPPLAAVCVATFAAGLALRWYAIRVLGRLFTVDVAIARDHVLVESGPYRWLRHPSYTGALLAFVALGLSYANLLAVATLVVVPAMAFAWRIVVEERALGDAFGPAYAEYRRRTWGLVPGVW
jgi:protein-S-isoprenylcysteine O-methyltransferase